MKSIIEEIFFESHGMFETIKTSNKYKMILANLNKNVKRLKEGLNEKQLEQVETISSLFGELEEEAAFIYYRAGIKTGFMLFVESL